VNEILGLPSALKAAGFDVILRTDAGTEAKTVTLGFTCSQAEGLTPAYTINGTDVTWNNAANGYRLPTRRSSPDTPPQAPMGPIRRFTPNRH